MSCWETLYFPFPQNVSSSGCRPCSPKRTHFTRWHSKSSMAASWALQVPCIQAPRAKRKKKKKKSRLGTVNLLWSLERRRRLISFVFLKSTAELVAIIYTTNSYVFLWKKIHQNLKGAASWKVMEKWVQMTQGAKCGEHQDGPPRDSFKRECLAQAVISFKVCLRFGGPSWSKAYSSQGGPYTMTTWIRV